VILNNFFKITPDKRDVKIRKTGGVIYSNPRWWKKIFFYFGSILVIFSLVGILYIYEPIMISWVKYKLIDQSAIGKVIEKIKVDSSEELIQPTIITNKPEDNKKTEPEPTPVPETDEFKIFIPKIGAEADIETNVSSYDKTEYMAVLKNNMVAQASGSDLPGDGNGTMIFLFAHSSEQGVFDARDNPVFYLLGKMETGDDILIDYKGTFITYKVYTKKVVGSKETEYLKYTEDNKEILILQTCWPIGTNWQRLLVFAEKI